jgi:hypothetical protein
VNVNYVHGQEEHFESPCSSMVDVPHAMTCGVMKGKQFVLECIVVFFLFTAIVFT